MLPGAVVFPLPEHFPVPHGLFPGRQEGVQPFLGQFLHRSPPGFVDFAHGHHHPFIQVADQFSQGKFRGPQPVQLFPDGGFIQSVLPGLFHNEPGVGSAGVPLFIRDGDFHGLAQTGGDFRIQGNPFLVVFPEILGGVLHQLIVIGPEHPVVEPDAPGHRNGDTAAGAGHRHRFAVDGHVIHGGAHPAPYADPEFQSVAQVQVPVQFQGTGGMIPAQALDPAQEHPPVVGPSVAHHGPARFFHHIGGGKIPVEDLFDVVPVFLGHFIMTGQIAVDGPAVNVRHHRHIFRPLHPPFDLEGTDAGLNQLGQHIQGVQVLGRQQVMACIHLGQHVLPLFVHQGVRQPAGLGTPAPVAAAAPDQAAHQALAAVAHAQSPVHEPFDFAGSGAAHGLQVLQGGFPGHHRLFHAVVIGKHRAGGIGHRHLGAGVERQFRGHLPGHPDHPQVLDDDPVHPDIAQKAQVFPQVGHFRVIHQGVHRYIDPYPVEMGKADGPGHFLRPEVFRIGPGSKMASSQVHRIGAGEDSRFQSFPGARRGQQFDIVSFHSDSFMIQQGQAPFYVQSVTLYFTIFPPCWPDFL